MTTQPTFFSARDTLKGRLNLHDHLVPHPESTFFFRARSDAMMNSGIHPADLLVVDRALTPASGRVVVAVVENELTVRRLHCAADHVALQADNPEFAEIRFKDLQELQVWGVVTYVIHRP
jgi:DNA polymerase V